MDHESVKTFDKIIESLDYDHAKDFNSKRTKSIEKDLKKQVNKNLNPPLALQPVENEQESSDLKRQGMQIIIPSNIIVIWTGLEVFLGLKLSGHTNTPTEVSNLKDEIYKRGEIQNELQYRNALDNLRTK